MTHPIIPFAERSVGNNALAATRFEVPFPIFDYADLVVTVDGLPVVNWTPDGDPLKCGAVGSGAVLFSAPVTGQVAITSRRKPRRERDFVGGAGLPIDVLNTDLDILAATAQELFRDLRASEARLAAVMDALTRTARFSSPIAEASLPTCGHYVLSVRNGALVAVDPAMFVLSTGAPLHDDALVTWEMIKDGLPLGGYCLTESTRPVDLGRSIRLQAWQLNDLPDYLPYCGPTDIQGPAVWLCGFDGDAALVYAPIDLPPESYVRCQ